MKLAANIRHVSAGIAEKVFKVRGQRSRSRSWPDETSNGGGIHFDAVASRITCWFSVPMLTICQFIFQVLKQCARYGCTGSRGGRHGPQNFSTAFA